MININFLESCFSKELFDQIIINLNLVFSPSKNKFKNLLTLNFSRFNLVALIKWVDERSKDKFFVDPFSMVLGGVRLQIEQAPHKGKLNIETIFGSF